MTVLADIPMTVDVMRFAFFVVAGLYFGVAFAVLRRYFTSPPRSVLRRIHVIGVSIGTSILVAGSVGLVYELLGASLRWYGVPVGLLGITVITGSLILLFIDQAQNPRSDGGRSTDRRPA